MGKAQLGSPYGLKINLNLAQEGLAPEQLGEMMAIRFDLEAHLEITSLKEEVSADIASLVDEANSTLLVKGVPPDRLDEGAKIVEWKPEEAKVSLRIRSGGVVRAHDALLRFKNLFIRKIGLKHKVGLRDVVVERCVILLTEAAVSLEEASKLLRGLASVSQEKGGLRVEFTNLREKDLRDRVIDRAVRLLRVREELTREEAEVLAPFGTVLRQGPIRAVRFTGDVASVAEGEGWMKRFPGRGQWIYTPPMVSLLRALEDLIAEKVCLPMGFEEWIFPRMLPMDVFKKLSTYVEHLPEGLFYVCAPPREPGVFEEFKREYMLRRELRTDLLKGILEEPSYVLDAVQCPPFYQYFSGETVRLEDLPVKAYDVAGGWTWRNEAGGVEGIVRTNEFWRMEMVFLSSPEEAVEIRDRVIDYTTDLVDKELDLEWRIVAGAPFYLSPEEARRKLIDISETSKIPTLDVECYLPYRGPRESAEWLEITAATVHRTFYVDAFKIKEAKGRDIWTGCVGHGLTRWAAAFLARHGFDFDEWPKAVRNKIGNLPKPVRTVA